MLRSVRLLLAMVLAGMWQGFGGAHAVAADGWRAQTGTFRIGLVERPGLDQAAAAAIRAAFGKALGVDVELFLARDQPALIDAHAAGRVDYAVYSAIGYATAWRLCACVEPLVAPMGNDGSAGIRSVLIERTDAGPERPVAVAAGDLARLLHPAAGAGTQPPRVVAAASFAQVEDMIRTGSAGSGFGWEAVDESGRAVGAGTLARLTNAGVAAASLRVVWRSEPLRYGPHAVRSSLAGEAKAILKALLLTLGETDPEVRDALEPRRGGGFRAVEHGDYRGAIEAVRALAEQGG